MQNALQALITKAYRARFEDPTVWHDDSNSEVNLHDYHKSNLHT